MQFFIIRGGDASEDADAGEERAPRDFACHQRGFLLHFALPQGGIESEGEAEHIVGLLAAQLHLFDGGRVYQAGVEHEGVFYGIVHRLFQGEHCRFVEVALVGEVVGISSLLGFHLCHVCHAFQPQHLLAFGLIY